MQAKLRAHEIQAFSRYRSTQGTVGVTHSTAGVTFEDGLYVGGDITGASGTSFTTDHIVIVGTAGDGYISYGAQTSNPAVAAVHTFADASGHFAIGQSGSSGKVISFTNGLMTVDRSYAFQDKAGTLAMTNDNISQFFNNAGYLTSTTGVPSTRTITEGAGLAGNTYDLSANRTVAMGTPGTLSITSVNSASGTSHTHAVSASSNPGAAAAILATDASGFLRIVRLGIGTAPTQQLHVAGNAFLDATTANLYMKDTSTGFKAGTTQIVTLQPSNKFQSSAFTSGLSGFSQDDATGNVEFNDGIFRGEFRASVFKINELSATAGTFGVFYSASTISTASLTAASVGGGMSFEAKNSDAGGMLFDVGDVVRMKAFTGSVVADAWVTIANRTNHTTYTTYGGTLSSGSTNTVFPAGTAVVDYGPSGTGFITLSTDGTVGASPNLTMATHAGSPWSSFTNLLRLGNLNGSYGYATDVYGLGIGDYSGEYLVVDPANGLAINAAGGNVNLDSNGLRLSSNASGSTPGAITWKYSGDTLGKVVNWSVPGGSVFTEISAVLPVSSSAGSSNVLMEAIGDGSAYVNFGLFTTGTSNLFPPGANKSYAGMSGINFQGFRIGSGAVPAHMLDVYGQAWAQDGFVPPNADGTKYSTDISGTTAVSIANNGTKTYSALGGLLILQGATVDGDTAMFVVGNSGTYIQQIAGDATKWSTASGTASKVNVYKTAVGGVTTIENKRGSTETFYIYWLRTR